MVLASHYVFQDVLNLLERERYGRLEEVCTIYRERYVEDDELLDVFDSVIKHITSDPRPEPKGLNERLSKLIRSRKMEASTQSGFI